MRISDWSSDVCSSDLNSHAVHMGAHANTAMGFPGYDAHVPPSAATTARVLRDQGYGTIALGKWDHVPPQYLSPAGPFDLWPLGQGFRSEEHTSELQSLMRISYAVFCLQKKKKNKTQTEHHDNKQKK